MENVYPDQFVPTKAVQTGVLRSATEGLCLSTPKGKKKDMVHKPVLSLPCKEYRNPVWNEQIWQYTGKFHKFKCKEITYHLDKGEIRHDEVCLDWSEGGNVILLNCHGQGGNQKWSYNKRFEDDLYVSPISFYLSGCICRTHQVKHQSQNCLTVTADSGFVTVSTCKVLIF